MMQPNHNDQKQARQTWGQVVATVVTSRPRTILGLGLALTLLAALGIANIRISNDMRGALSGDSPVLNVLRALEDLFGSAETIVIAARHPELDAFAPEVLADVWRATRALRRTEGVAHVESLATAEQFTRGDDGGLEIRRFLERPPRTPEAAVEIAAAVQADEDVRRAFIAADGGGHAFYIDPKPGVDDETTIAAIQATLAETLSGYELHTTGLPVLRVATNHVIQNDLIFLLPASAAMLALILAMALRSIIGVVVTLFTVLLSILPAAGFMGLIGIPISSETATFPVLVLAVSCGDAVHILSLYYWRLKQGQIRDAAIHNVVSHLALPVLLTSLTTAGGFLSLLTSPIPPMAGLGAAVAVGVMWAWLLSTFMLPALLMLLPTPKFKRAGGVGIHGFLRRVTTGRLLHAGAVSMLALGLVAGVAGYGLPRIEREIGAENVFPRGHAARIDAAAIDRDFQSGAPMELLIHGRIDDVDLVRRVDALATDLSALDVVGSVDGITTVLRRILGVMNGSETIPNDAVQVSEALLLYSMSGSPDRYRRLVATDGSALRVTVRLPNLPADELERVVSLVQGLVSKHLAGVDVGYTGKALIMLELSHSMVESAVVTLIASLCVVFLFCTLTFRSLRYGLMAMVPLGIAIVFNFGYMGAVGIPLTIATALISGLVIGVGVDYGVHMLARWRAGAGADRSARIRGTVVDVAPPILANAFAVGSGLSVLMLSQFEPIRQLGHLALVSMYAAALGALVFIPSLLIATTKEKTMIAKPVHAALCAFLLLFPAMSDAAEAAAGADQTPDAKALLERAQNLGRPKSMSATLQMVLIDSSDRRQERTLELRKLGNDKQVVWFTAPTVLRGTAFLRLGNGGDKKMWLWLPGMKKLERIAGAKEHKPFLGSDFTYGDMGERDLESASHRYEGRNTLDGRAVHVVRSTPKTIDDDAAYGDIVTYIDEANGLELGEDLYDPVGDLFKRKRNYDFVDRGGYLLPQRIVMEDLIAEHRTELSFTEIAVDTAVDEAIFDANAIQRIRP